MITGSYAAPMARITRTSTQVVLDDHPGSAGRVARAIGGTAITAIGLGSAVLLVPMVAEHADEVGLLHLVGTVAVGGLLLVSVVVVGLTQLAGAVTGAGRTWTFGRDGIHLHERGWTGRVRTAFANETDTFDLETNRSGDRPSYALVVRDDTGRGWTYPLGEDWEKAHATYSTALAGLYGVDR